MHDLLDWIRALGPPFEQNHGRYLLPLVAMLLVASRWVLGREGVARSLGPHNLRRARGALLAVLSLIAVLSVGVYHNFFNFHYGGFLNAYEFYHYYSGSKYFRELGYFELYNATLVADADSGRLYRPRDGVILDLESYRYVPVGEVLQRADEIRGRFSEERWREFVEDVRFFKTRLGPARWNQVLKDKGYNATPAWTMLVGSGLSGRVSTADGRGMLLLALLDELLLAAAVLCVAWTFGAWSALLMVVFLSSSYLMAHVHMKGAFLRTDFVVCLVVAVCALRRGRHGWAGALVGYSTVSRLFPAVFVFGLGCKLLWEFLPSLRRGELGGRMVPYLRFFTAFGSTVTLLLGASLLWAGADGWRDFGRKLELHRSRQHIWDVGFDSVFAADFGGGGSQPLPQAGAGAPPPADGPRIDRQALERRAPLVWLLRLLALALCAVAVKTLDDAQALAFGFVPLFFLVAPSYYYYIVLLLPLLFFATGPPATWRALGTLYLFFLGMMGFRFYYRWDQYFPTYYWNSVLALGLVLLMLAVVVVRGLRAAGSPKRWLLEPRLPVVDAEVAPARSGGGERP